MTLKMNFGNCNMSAGKYSLIGVVVITFLIIVASIAIHFNKKKCKCGRNNCECGDSHSSSKPKKETFVNNKTSNTYNALYTTPNKYESGYFKYTQPPGDVKAQKYAKTGQGTSGSFFPLQGNGAQIMMANSSSNNDASPSVHKGKIGGHPNYTEKEFTSWINGFNNFGSPFSHMKQSATTDDHYSNSYLIDGSNERVENAGQKGHLKCSDWWPHLEKNEAGFCTTANDAMVNCKPDEHQAKSIQSCLEQGGNRFVNSKMMPRWQKI